MDKSSRPPMMLVGGRTVGLAATFAKIGIILARLFDPSVFASTSSSFLVFATLYGVLQLGMAESLYYFVPRAAGAHRPYVANAVVRSSRSGASARWRCTSRGRHRRWITRSWRAMPFRSALFLTFSLASRCSNRDGCRGSSTCRRPSLTRSPTSRRRALHRARP